ncbi:MAG: hypothetical protein HUJ56_01840 [Erysipelotrichaceae bacterium]|nr:hypothetical protein [Erysipelotrichaceae bacterium]
MDRANLIICILVAIVIFGVIGFIKGAQTLEERDTPKLDKPYHTVYTFDYEGHSYIWFEVGYRAGVVHNPDCKCYTDTLIFYDPF